MLRALSSFATSNVSPGVTSVVAGGAQSTEPHRNTDILERQGSQPSMASLAPAQGPTPGESFSGGFSDGMQATANGIGWVLAPALNSGRFTYNQMFLLGAGVSAVVLPTVGVSVGLANGLRRLIIG